MSWSSSAYRGSIPVLCVPQVNWTLFLDRNVSGGLEVEPKSSVLYSTAIVFSKVRDVHRQLLLLLPLSTRLFVSDPESPSGETLVCVVAAGV